VKREETADITLHVSQHAHQALRRAISRTTRQLFKQLRQFKVKMEGKPMWKALGLRVKLEPELVVEIKVPS
jgi:hypothetical protein